MGTDRPKNRPSQRPSGRPSTRVGRVDIDVITFDDALRTICDLSRFEGGVVLTPNVDHIVRAERDEAFSNAYEKTALTVVDGMPVLWASYLTNAPLPGRIAGADLFEPLMDLAEKEGLTVYLLGGRKDAAVITRERLRARLPHLLVVGIGPSTREITEDPALLAAVEREIAEKKPNIVIVALGSPLQEMWATEVAPRLKPSVFLGLGSVLGRVRGPHYARTRRAPTRGPRMGVSCGDGAAQALAPLRHGRAALSCDRPAAAPQAIGRMRRRPTAPVIYHPTRSSRATFVSASGGLGRSLQPRFDRATAHWFGLRSWARRRARRAARIQMLAPARMHWGGGFPSASSTRQSPSTSGARYLVSASRRTGTSSSVIGTVIGAYPNAGMMISAESKSARTRSASASGS